MYLLHLLCEFGLLLHASGKVGTITEHITVNVSTICNLLHACNTPLLHNFNNLEIWFDCV